MFHRVDDMYAMPAATFFALAPRLAAYQGAMRARLQAEAAESEDAPPPSPAMPAQVGTGPQMVGASRAELQSEPSFAGIFSFGSSGGG